MKNKQTTRVCFLLDPDGEVFAFFPRDYNFPDGSLRGSYAHIGQHSACHIDYANECKGATPEEYSDLFRELESIGYNLKVINKPKKFL